MKLKGRTFFYLVLLAIGVTASAPFVSQKSFGALAQNRVSGHVTGINRQPLDHLNVELMDDYYRTIGRTRTNGSGYYEFFGISAGNFTVRVYTFGTDYDEQEGKIEIVNITSSNGSGGLRTGGFSNEQLDFNMKLRRGVTPENVAIFVQEIPPEAKRLFDKAISDLADKHDSEALAELRSAVDIFPKYYYALERLGTEYIRIGKPETFQAAAILFTLAVEINPRGFKSWYGLAYARYSLRQFPEALVAVEKAIEVNQNASESFLLAGVLMRETKKYTEAEKQFIRARDVSNDPNPRVHWELALLYGNDMKRYADAAHELKLFLKAKPDAKDSENIKKLIAKFETKAQKP